MALVFIFLTAVVYLIDAKLKKYKWFRRLRGGTWIYDDSAPNYAGAGTVGWIRVKRSKPEKEIKKIEEY